MSWDTLLDAMDAHVQRQALAVERGTEAPPPFALPPAPGPMTTQQSLRALALIARTEALADTAATRLARLTTPRRSPYRT